MLLSLAHCGGQETPEQPSREVSSQATSSWGPPATIVSFQASADTYVAAAQPTLNFGDARKLVADLSPERETYLRFNPGAVRGRVTRATLRLFAKDGTRSGLRVFLAGSHWEENLLTWSTRPQRLGAALDAEGTIPTGTWVELDVTRAVYGSGEYNFVLVGARGDGADFHSRESTLTDLRPQLVLTLEDPPVGCLPITVPTMEEPLCTYHGTGGGLTGWVRQEGGPGPERLRALASDATGGFVAAGLFGEVPFPNGKGFSLARHAAGGMPLWSRQVTTGDVTVADLTLTPGGHILVVGSYEGSPDLGTGPLPYTDSSAGDTDSGLFIARFSPDGEPEWAHGFEASYPQEGGRVALPISPREVATDSQGNLLVTGGFHGELDLGGGSLFAGLPSVNAPGGSVVPGGFLAKFSARGGHLWSKVFPADAPEIATDGRSVATDGADNVLVGVSAFYRGALPDGPVGEARPFITKYDAAGSPLWTREFSGAHGQLLGVRPLGRDTVAFIANLVLPTTFGGRTYITGSLGWDTFVGLDPSAYLGTLSATGEDGWLRRLIYSVAEDGELDGLVTGEDGTLTVVGHGEYLNLGGGLLRPHNDSGFAVQAPFVARYSRAGIHLWSRTFDVDFEGGDSEPRFFLEPLPGGSVLAGSDFTSPILLKRRTYTSRGQSDLLFLRLRP